MIAGPVTAAVYCGNKIVRFRMDPLHETAFNMLHKLRSALVAPDRKKLIGSNIKKGTTRPTLTDSRDTTA